MQESRVSNETAGHSHKGTRIYDMCNKVSILSLFEKELFYKLIDN